MWCELCSPSCMEGRQHNSSVSQSVCASSDQEDNKVKKLDHGSYVYSRLTIKIASLVFPSYGEFPPPPILSFINERDIYIRMWCKGTSRGLLDHFIILHSHVINNYTYSCTLYCIYTGCTHNIIMLWYKHPLLPPLPHTHQH